MINFIASLNLKLKLHILHLIPPRLIYTRFISTSNMVLSIEERIFLIEYVFRATGEYTDEVKKKFIEKLPEIDLPHRNKVCNLINKFREHGSVKDAPPSSGPTILTEKKVNVISETIACRPN